MGNAEPASVPGWARRGLQARTYGVLATAATAVALIVSPATGAGMALALASGAFCVYGLACLGQALAAMGGTGDPLGRRTGWILTVVLLKYPLLFGAWSISGGIGKDAEKGFIAGVLLVYSAAVGWAQAKQASSA